RSGLRNNCKRLVVQAANSPLLQDRFRLGESDLSIHCVGASRATIVRSTVDGTPPGIAARRCLEVVLDGQLLGIHLTTLYLGRVLPAAVVVIVLPAQASPAVGDNVLPCVHSVVCRARVGEGRISPRRIATSAESIPVVRDDRHLM